MAEDEKKEANAKEKKKRGINTEEVETVGEIATEKTEELSDLEQANRQWHQEKEDLLNQLKRKQADIDNLRRISKMEQTEARQYALHEFLCRLLPVLDNLERGLESARNAEALPSSYIEGLEMIRKQMMQILEQEGVSVIDAVGAPFDPHCHHAVLQEESKDSEPGLVLEELQKGYRHRERILRPSMVKVCGD